MTALASVQTTTDSASITWVGVLLAIGALIIIGAAIAAPALINAWRATRHHDDDGPLALPRRDPQAVRLPDPRTLRHLDRLHRQEPR